MFALHSPMPFTAGDARYLPSPGGREALRSSSPFSTCSRGRAGIDLGRESPAARICPVHRSQLRRSACAVERSTSPYIARRPFVESCLSADRTQQASVGVGRSALPFSSFEPERVLLDETPIPGLLRAARCDDLAWPDGIVSGRSCWRVPSSPISVEDRVANPSLALDALPGAQWPALRG